MSIDWKKAQAALGVTADGAPGRKTYGALLARAAARTADTAIDSMAQALAQYADDFGQDATPARLAEFVAQIEHETGGFRRFVENLNYTTAAGVQRTWPSRFPTLASAQTCVRNPEALANKVYARPKEGNTQPGDGFRYRGRGALQLTFRNNYRRFGELLDLPLEANPDLAADPAVSVRIALEFFKLGRVNAAIDKGDFREARRITNGGALGLEDVAATRKRLLAVLS